VEHYLEASINPHETEAGACLPVGLLPLPSQKVKGFAKGSFATGTTGFGFLTLAPAMANDAIMVTTSNSTTVQTVGTSVATITTPGQFDTFSPINIPYNNAEFAATYLQCRAVTYGVRIRCTSSMMSRGGSYVGIEDENHLNGALFSIANAKSNSLSVTRAIPLQVDPDAWDYSLSSSGPTDQYELEFSSSSYNYTPGVTPTPLFVGISSAVPGMTFDFEATIHCEFTGPTPGALKTKSHASPVGFSSSVEAMKEYVVKHGPVSTESGPSVLQSFKNFFMNEGPQLLEIGSGIARSIMGDPSGFLSIADGGMRMIADAINPIPYPNRQLTATQKSILAPEARDVYR
jgi:hypothetical protein